MAALLASVCSVPLTSVLLLFELTKDYHILLPLMVFSIACDFASARVMEEVFLDVMI